MFKKLIDRASNFLDGRPSDTLFLIMSVIMAVAFLFVAKDVIPWLLSSAITLEGIYHLASTLFFVFAGWVAYQEFYVSNRAEQISQIDSIKPRLAKIYVEILSTPPTVMWNVDNASNLEELRDTLKSQGATYAFMLDQLYFQNINHLSFEVREAIQLFLNQQKRMIDGAAVNLWKQLKFLSASESSFKEDYIKWSIAQCRTTTASVKTASGELFDGERPWEMGVTVHHNHEGFANQVHRELGVVAKTSGYSSFENHQRHAVHRLEKALDKELKRLVRAR